MKKSNILYAIIAGVIIVGIILYFSLRHTATDGHKHSAEEGVKTEEKAHEEEK